MIELATRGLAVCGIASERFDRFSRQVLEQRNAGDLGLAVVAHPIGGIPPAVAREHVTAEVLEEVIRALTQENPR
jgi:hypothetical protein